MHFVRVKNVLIACLALAALNACLSGGGGDGESDPQPSPPPGGSNGSPTISGTPPAQAVVGSSYSFSPTINDPDGDSLTITAQNLPSWLDINASTGLVVGTPGVGDVRTFADIVITVSDGTASDSLGPFSIEVVQAAGGTATLSWNAPTTNEDGSTLEDLAGFKIYYGTSEWDFTEVINIDNPGLSMYVVENLAPGTYYFVMTAYDEAGNESAFSEMLSKTVTSS